MPPLSPTILHILLALGQKDRHGYETMKQVTADSGGTVKIAAGTLYNALHRLVEAGLVVESGDRPAPEMDDERRRYYALTGLGRQVLRDELARLQSVLSLGTDRLGELAFGRKSITREAS